MLSVLKVELLSDYLQSVVKTHAVSLVSFMLTPQSGNSLSLSVSLGWCAALNGHSTFVKYLNFTVGHKSKQANKQTSKQVNK